MREQDHLADRAFPGEQHRQPVHSHAETALRRHAVGHGAQVILVHRVQVLVFRLEGVTHLHEARFLVERVVQLGKGVAELHPADVAFEALHRGRVARLALRQG